MRLVAAAVCPHPPLLIPQLAAGAAGELDDLRRCCDEAVAGLLAAGPEAIVVVGSGEQPARWPQLPATAFPGPFAGFGRGGPASDVPLSVAVGGWLLDRAGWTGRRPALALGSKPDTTSFVSGSGTDGATALLVMGDGSACRTPGSPGSFDPRAQSFDDTVATALAHADLATLAGLDLDLAAELRVAGVGPWQFLAGAAAGSSWHARLLAHEAPYGVGYLVALWTREAA